MSQPAEPLVLEIERVFIVGRRIDDYSFPPTLNCESSAHRGFAVNRSGFAGGHIV
jgi:hypothetical protein